MILSAFYSTQAQAEVGTDIKHYELNWGTSIAYNTTVDLQGKSVINCVQSNPIIYITKSVHQDTNKRNKFDINITFVGVQRGFTHFDCYIEPFISGGKDFFVTGTITVR